MALCMTTQSAQLKPVHYFKCESATTSLAFVGDCEQLQQRLLLASGDVSGHVTLTDMESCDTVAKWRAHAGSCRTVLPLSNCGGGGEGGDSGGGATDLLLTQSPQRSVCVWSLSSQQLVRSIAVTHSGFCRCVPLAGGTVVCPADGGGSGGGGGNVSRLCVLDPRRADARVQWLAAPPAAPLASASYGQVMSVCHVQNGGGGGGALIAVYESADLVVWQTTGDGRGVHETPLFWHKLSLPDEHAPLALAAASIAPKSCSALRYDVNSDDTTKAQTHTASGTSGSGCGSETDLSTLSSFNVQAVVATSGQPLPLLLDTVGGQLQLVGGRSSCSSRRSRWQLATEGQSAASVRQDGRLCALGCWDGGVRLLSWPRLRPLACLRQHTASVECIVWSGAERRCHLWNASRLMATGSSDGTIALWKVYDE